MWRSTSSEADWKRVIRTEGASLGQVFVCYCAAAETSILRFTEIINFSGKEELSLYASTSTKQPKTNQPNLNTS